MFFLSRFFKLDKEYVDALSHAGTIGLHMVSGIAVGTLIGYGLDAWLETSPWLTGVFMVIGIVAGFKNVYVDTNKLIKSQEREDSKRSFAQGESKNGNIADNDSDNDSRP